MTRFSSGVYSGFSTALTLSMFVVLELPTIAYAQEANATTTNLTALQTSPSPAILPPDAQAAIDHAKGLSKAFRVISKLAAPSVVSIEVQAPVMSNRMRGGQVPPRGVGMGTGFIVNQEGFIATNNHVVGTGGLMKVRLHDGRECVAKLVGSDRETDIAVLKIDLPDLHAIEFANSDHAEVGDWVLALGSPFGLADSVTAGIISAKGRQVGLSALESYLQTDATINPGNSGGPLVDMDGRVAGMNTAIESRSGGSDGIGFAIPANLARGVVESIIAGSTPARGFLGIKMEAIDPESAERLSFSGAGVLIHEVIPGGAADRAGLKADDIVVKVNGEATGSLQKLHRAVRLCIPGAAYPIEVVRAGETILVTATLGDASKQLANSLPIMMPNDRPTPRRGQSN